MVENIVGKGENGGYQRFLLFPQCFQNASFVVKHDTRLPSFQCKSLLLTLSQTSPGFYVSFIHNVGKAEIVRNDQFLLFPQCFLPL